MSIHLIVGFQTTDGQKDEFTTWVQQRLVAINQFLLTAGEPSHQEPCLPPEASLTLSITRGMFPFRDFAHQVTQETNWQFPHLLEVGGNWGFYLPRPATTVLYPPATTQTGPFGSSYQLLWECLLLSRLLGIQDEVVREEEVPTAVWQTLPTITPQANSHPAPADGCEKMVRAALHSIHTQAVLLIH